MKKKYIDKNIELRSEEVQEVMNKIPPSILRYGISVLFCIIGILFIGSALFSYPDTINAELTLTTKTPPAYVIAKTSGRIEQLFVSNQQSIKKGDIIGVIENVAYTEDVFYLRERIKDWKMSGSRIELIDNIFFHQIPELGNIQPAYSSCATAWRNYLQHMQENRIYETELLNAIASLINAIAEWESIYLLTSPDNGTIAFMQLWEKNQNIESGETMFVVIPSDAIHVVGKVLLPMDGIGKVKNGQRAIARLPSFPTEEFGFIEGKVYSISPVPDSEGKYILEISFPNGLHTSYNKKLPLIKTIKGTVSIVTKERSLLARLININ